MEKLRCNEAEHMDAAHRLEAQHKAIIQDIQELHSNETLLDEKIRALKEELHGTIGNRLDHFVASFGKIQEALGEQSELEKLRANETQELQKSLKELQVNYQQLRAEKHTDTLGHTVQEKTTATPLSPAQEKGEPSIFHVFQGPSRKDDPYTVLEARIMDDPYMLYGIIQHIKEQLQQPNCYNIPALRAQLQVAETEYSMMTKSEEERKQLRTRRAYDNWLHNNPQVGSKLAS